MKTTIKSLDDTKLELTLVADEEMLQAIKQEVLKGIRRNAKVQGFRPGKAPLSMVEKQTDPNALQSEFLERAVNRLYADAVMGEKLRPVSSPQITIDKFVPYATLELKATVEVVGKVTIPDYKKIKLAKKDVKITTKDIDEVVEALQTRAATKKAVERGAKEGDEAVIDFKGTDAKTEKPISGADGKDYPLMLGSDSFIPGFEKNLSGLKAGEDKEFTLTFPKDYGVSTLQNRKVKFAVNVKAVNELEKPKADDDFASKAGPFKTLKDLRDNIEVQLKQDRQQQEDRDYESQLLEQVAEKSTVAIPPSLVDEEISRMEADERQNIMYRGQTWQEHLDEEGVTEAEHHDQKRPNAEQRVKAGLVLAEIAEREGIDVTKEELDLRMQLLKGQYTDKAMQAQLDKPESRRDIAGRMVTEKTIAKLVEYSTAK